MAKTSEKGALKHKSILDSGTTRHMINDVAALRIIRGVNSVMEIGNGNTVESLKVGTLTVTTMMVKEA